MTTGLKILIVGGYGVFGSRIVELLENDARLTLFVGGRSVAKAKTFVASRTLAKAELCQPRSIETATLAGNCPPFAPTS